MINEVFWATIAITSAAVLALVITLLTWAIRPHLNKATQAADSTASTRSHGATNQASTC